MIEKGKYADDASMLVANRPIITGKDAIRGVYKALLDDALAMDLSPAKVEVSRSGDLAYSQGAYRMTFTDPKTKKPMIGKVKYVEVYKKQADGSWKMIEDTGNADGPVAPAK